MIFRDLIKDTVWIPGRDYGNTPSPQLSILLPTFSRGRSGLFARCVDSIIEQTLKNIELIIIDDASVDGTADLISEYMEKDGRISCLRHVRNIGLPAVSEYEGFFRARATRIAFAFDDNFFHEDAFEGLLRESVKKPDSMIYGYLEIGTLRNTNSDVVRVRFGQNEQLGALQSGNIIANSTVLLPRKIIEDVGFYDPHIALARVCDWDLWRRVARRYEINHADVAVGFEDGPVNSDSLGNIYQLDSWVASEWMASFRDEYLRPENIGDYDVFSIPSSLNVGSLQVLEALAEKHAVVRGWSKPDFQFDENKERQNGHILVVNLTHDASTSLCFDSLPAEISGSVRTITYNSCFDLDEFARATIIIFVRFIENFRPWIDAAKKNGIPCYFYIDDNLPLLVEEEEVHFENSHIYRSENFRKELILFDGVFLTSKRLLEYFQKKMLHDNCNFLPVTWVDQRPVSAKFSRLKDEITIVVFGGTHRQDGWKILCPALEKIIAKGKRIHLVGHFYGRHLGGVDLFPLGLRVTHVPYESLYCQALVRLGAHKPDFLIHLPSVTKNNEYKTLHPLLTANLLDAVPVLPGTYPYQLADEAGAAAVIRASEDPLSWYEGLSRLFSDPDVCVEIKKNNKVFCANNFSGKESIVLLGDTLRKHGGEVSWKEQARRLNGLIKWIRSSAANSVAVPGMANADFSALLSSSMSLATHRKVMRHSFCGRLSRANKDLWSQVGLPFFELKQFSESKGWRKRGASLELSDSLHEMPYREYVIRLTPGRLDYVQFAVASDGIQVGLVGVEVVSPRGVIKFQRAIDLRSVDLNWPVRFDVDGVNVSCAEDWSIRVFVKSVAPIYVYEFINKKFMGIKYAASSPFMSLGIEGV